MNPKNWYSTSISRSLFARVTKSESMIRRHQFASGDIVSELVMKWLTSVIAQGGNPATATHVILGTIRASLYTDSWLAASSKTPPVFLLTVPPRQDRSPSWYEKERDYRSFGPNLS